MSPDRTGEACGDVFVEKGTVCRSSRGINGGAEVSIVPHQGTYTLQAVNRSQACQLSLLCRESQDFELNLMISLFYFNISLQNLIL